MKIFSGQHFQNNFNFDFFHYQILDDLRFSYNFKQKLSEMVSKNQMSFFILLAQKNNKRYFTSLKYLGSVPQGLLFEYKSYHLFTLL